MDCLPREVVGHIIDSIGSVKESHKLLAVHSGFVKASAYSTAHVVHSHLALVIQKILDALKKCPNTCAVALSVNFTKGSRRRLLDYCVLIEKTPNTFHGFINACASNFDEPDRCMRFDVSVPSQKIASALVDLSTKHSHHVLREISVAFNEQDQDNKCVYTMYVHDIITSFTLVPKLYRSGYFTQGLQNIKTEGCFAANGTLINDVSESIIGVFTHPPVADISRVNSLGRTSSGSRVMDVHVRSY